MRDVARAARLEWHSASNTHGMGGTARTACVASAAQHGLHSASNTHGKRGTA